MQPSEKALSAPIPAILPRTVPVSPTLQARINPVVDARTGDLAGVDLRLWRKSSDHNFFGATAAGLRIPLAAIRALAAALSASADELGAP